jgi:lysophospholipase L1-like esterase
VARRHSRRRRSSNEGSFLGNLVLFALSCLVGLMVAEGAAWLVQPPAKPGMPQNLLERGPGDVWRVTPGFRGVMDNRVDFRDATVTADSDGVRLVPAAPAEAPRRLLVIGDSQTFGHGLSDEESWPNRLQQDLNLRGVTARVVNMGVPGVNIDQYENRIILLGSQIQPTDTVLIGVSWNDLITPPSAAEVNKLVEGYLVSAASATNVEEVRARVRFFEFTGIVVPPFQSTKEFFDSMSQSSALVGLLYPRVKAIYYRLRSHSPVAGLVKDGVPEANVVKLRQLADMVASHGARIVVALLPERMFFEDDAYAIYSVNGREFPTQDFMASLALPHCEKLGLTCLNAFPLLHDHHRDGLVFKVDGHFNAKGAALLGPWLAGQLYP